MGNKILTIRTALLGACAIMLIISLFIPVWKIELTAPQYPEGLGLQIYMNKLGGDVEIINGLNHYIGMRTLHSNEFIEFTVLPYIISFFALLCLVAVFIRNRKMVMFTLVLFLIFGIVAMFDFWRWEYDYGHNLDPNAAIIVPGMAYQPPLIGFKQLLNFGAFSIPDIGGWLLLATGGFLLIQFLIESGWVLKKYSANVSVLGIITILAPLMVACGKKEAEPILYFKDHCESCKMTIADGRYSTELITEKGRVYKFDDVVCMLQYMKEKKINASGLYVGSIYRKDTLYNAHDMYYVSSGKFASPMGGNIAAFPDKDSALYYSKKYETGLLSWPQLIQL